MDSQIEANLQSEHDRMTKAEFANALAHSLEERENLLKIMSMNHYDMEENSRIERLIEFKVIYGQTLTEVYPYTVVTEKQKEAMAQAKADYVYMSVYEITYAEVKKLLGA